VDVQTHGMKKSVAGITVLLFLSIQGFSQQNQHPNWLVGTWTIKTGKGMIVEEWKVLNDTTLTGRSVFVKPEKDSVLQETLEFSFRNGSWFYISKVVGQNNNLPVAFKVIYLGQEEFISENPAHDFPQRISYRKIKNQLFASIEGNSRGKYVKQNFDYTSDQ
jgi:hypothetical protein